MTWTYKLGKSNKKTNNGNLRDLEQSKEKREERNVPHHCA